MARRELNRLSTKLWLDALRRQLEANGDFATVLTRGDPTAGAAILVIRGRSGTVSAYARSNMGDGKTSWRALVSDEEEPSENLAKTLEKQRRYDPDLWIIELDVADPARFIAELPGIS